jgi:hypothetical protein
LTARGCCSSPYVWPDTSGDNLPEFSEDRNLVDANFPASSLGVPVIRLDGASVTRALDGPRPNCSRRCDAWVTATRSRSPQQSSPVATTRLPQTLNRGENGQHGTLWPRPAPRRSTTSSNMRSRRPSAGWYSWTAPALIRAASLVRSLPVPTS